MLLARPCSVYIVSRAASTGADTDDGNAHVRRDQMAGAEGAVYVFLCLPLYLKQEKEGSLFLGYIRQHKAVLPLPQTPRRLRYARCWCAPVCCEKEGRRRSDLLRYPVSQLVQPALRGIPNDDGQKGNSKEANASVPPLPFSTWFPVKMKV